MASSPGSIHPGQPIGHLCEAAGAVKRQAIAGTCLENMGRMWNTKIWKKIRKKYGIIEKSIRFHAIPALASHNQTWQLNNCLYDFLS